MAETNVEKQHIRLFVYDENIDVYVKPEEEEYYSAAAKFITERYNMYAQTFKGRRSDHTIALLTLVEIALRYERELAKNDTTPYDNILSKLTAEIEEALK